MSRLKLNKLERDIIRQVEHYFGDSNLGHDKFMQRSLDAGGGWISFDLLLTFKRLAALSTDADLITDALLKSDSGLLEISEDRRKLRRSPKRPLPQQDRKEVDKRTLHVRGFPLSADISELLEFFSAYEKVVDVHLRKYLDVVHTKTYKFNGGVYVTFETRAQAQQFLNRQKITFEGRILKSEWCPPRINRPHPLSKFSLKQLEKELDNAYENVISESSLQPLEEEPAAATAHRVDELLTRKSCMMSGSAEEYSC